MRILFLVPEAFGGRGGIAELMRGHLEALAENCEVVVIARSAKDPVGTLPPGTKYYVTHSSSKLVHSLKCLVVALLNKPFDSIFVGHINFLPLVNFIKPLCGGKAVQFIFGIDVWQKPKSWLVRNSIRKIDLVASISKISSERFKQWSNHSADCLYLPPFIDTEKFTPGEKSSELSEKYALKDKQVVLTLCRLSTAERYKGIDEVLEALVQLPDIHYLIGGEGDDKPRLMQKAESLNLSDRVTFLGYIPEDQKADYYRLADAFLMPGSGEGFGIVYLEALACGIPCLGSMLDGSKEALRDGKLGVLVDPSKAGQVLEGIKEVLARKRGSVPEGLDFFSKNTHRERVEELLSVLEP